MIIYHKLFHAYDRLLFMWFISILYLIVMINCYNIDKIDDDDDDGDILYFVPFES